MFVGTEAARKSCARGVSTSSASPTRPSGLRATLIRSRAPPPLSTHWGVCRRFCCWEIAHYFPHTCAHSLVVFNLFGMLTQANASRLACTRSLSIYLYLSLAFQTHTSAQHNQAINTVERFVWVVCACLHQTQTHIAPVCLSSAEKGCPI